MSHQIEKPDLSKITEERREFLMNNIIEIYAKNDLNKYSNEDYYPWNKIKYQPLPDLLKSHEELWYIISFFRFSASVNIQTEKGQHFRLGKPSFLDELLHNIDYGLAGNFLGIDFSESERKTFLQNGIAEEAISSSQLEGAMTTSKEAKRLIAGNKKPISLSEKMIINNYKAMIFIRNELKDKNISRESLLELQKIITNGTLDNKEKEGRLRTDIDDVAVVDKLTGDIWHIPPKEAFLQKQIDILIDYANDKDGRFTHPFIKAVLLHFWIAYLHPFCDGNGRTARAVFYWYLCKKGYWGFDYAPISRIIRDSKRQYEDAFIYSEQDSFDLTYFLVYIAKKTKQAFDEFKEYVEKQRKKQSKGLKLFSGFGLNERQVKLLNYFVLHKSNFTNKTIHKNYYGISYNTARSDLEKLVELGFLRAIKEGIYNNYYPVDNFEEKIKNI